jgi:hypothetical protein
MLSFLFILVLAAVGSTIQVQKHNEFGAPTTSGFDTGSQGSRLDGDLSLTQEAISERIRVLRNQGFKVIVRNPKPFVNVASNRGMCHSISTQF